MSAKEIRYNTSKRAEWYLPEDVKPPRGEMIHLLTVFGKSITGLWDDNGFYVAWHPFLKMNEKVREAMKRKQNAYFSK